MPPRYCSSTWLLASNAALEVFDDFTARLVAATTRGSWARSLFNSRQSRDFLRRFDGGAIVDLSAYRTLVFSGPYLLCNADIQKGDENSVLLPN